MSWRIFSTAAAALALLAACGNDTTGPAATTSVVAVQPAGGATGVDPAAPIVITFSHAMHAGMEAYMALHEGDVAGPVVPGNATWSMDFTVLTFTPNAPLKAQTQYTLHLGGAMRDAANRPLNYGSCVGEHGGGWVMEGMMGGGGMGPDWRHQNGSYGVALTFTTA